MTTTTRCLKAKRHTMPVRHMKAKTCNNDETFEGGGCDDGETCNNGEILGASEMNNGGVKQRHKVKGATPPSTIPHHCTVFDTANSAKEQPPSMEAFPLNHHPQSLRSSFHYSLTLSTSSTLVFNPQCSSSIVASLSDPDPKSLQFFNHLRKVPSFVTITAASVLFLGFWRNGSLNKSLSSVVSIEEAASDEKGTLEEDVLRVKLKETVPIVHDFWKTRIADEEAWLRLKGEVFNSGERLEFLKVGFEGMLEKERKGFHDCVLEQLERVDECMTLLKEIKVAMDRCEKKNTDLRHSLRFFSKVVAHVRILEANMFHALNYYKELDKD
ncbi:hypothetical protein VNO78_16208 [Psophocarpus tetragonolobus]|uniref:Uncharacterized protein n=1 Tax=Psophocarpus tetragonolobus TaxID=3891 RepID=A0AAN9SFE0_PSOTE